MLLKPFLIIYALLLFEEGNCKRTFNPFGGLFRRLMRATEGYNKYESIRVNNGYLANPYRQPFIVYVGKMPQEGIVDPEVLCTGLLVNSSSVLTTASCATLFDKDQLLIAIRSVNYVILLLHVTKVTLHPKYEPNIKSVIKSPEYNVAILNLERLVNENELPGLATFRAAKYSTGLIMDDLVENKARCKSMGYGISSLHPKDAGLLRSYNMSLLHTDDCISHYSDSSINSLSHVCARLEEADDDCFFEDGAPLICENRVYALFASFSSEECASKPNVFIRLDSLKDFLTTEVLQSPKNNFLSSQPIEDRSLIENQVSNEITSSEKEKSLLIAFTNENTHAASNEEISLTETDSTSDILNSISKQKRAANVESKTALGCKYNSSIMQHNIPFDHKMKSNQLYTLYIGVNASNCSGPSVGYNIAPPLRTLTPLYFICFVVTVLLQSSKFKLNN